MFSNPARSTSNQPETHSVRWSHDHFPTRPIFILQFADCRCRLSIVQRGTPAFIGGGGSARGTGAGPRAAPMGFREDTRRAGFTPGAGPEPSPDRFRPSLYSRPFRNTLIPDVIAFRHSL
ncbi:hypothetical protein C791_7755 [Amycolatopsis azurea DSM 43854]|uniref:Uncharacterized protein n=1 Tax=Amycolatopsis azurea DSM 43854 TaxID=1238180 RepID=M2PU75_9PSEU|nr:hypothetical protein C791_7755 [Amycolatopsis azurea DSM 43854]